MAQPTALAIPIEKAVYLFTRDTVPGQGGDKQKFWQTVMGFESPTAIRAAVLGAVTVADLVFQRQDQYGDRYQAITRIRGETGLIWWVRTGWIVRPGETVARFVTAIPERRREN